MPGKRNDEKDERVKLPLDPETAMRALLAVDPNGESYPPARHSGIMRTVGASLVHDWGIEDHALKPSPSARR